MCFRSKKGSIHTSGGIQMKRKAMGLTAIFAIPVILYLLFSFIAEGFGVHSLPIVLSQCAIPLLIGFGIFITMQAGMFDFSVGVRVVFAALLGASLEPVFGAVGILVGSIAGGVIGGVVIGLLYRYLKVPSMVIALGFVLVFEVIGAKIAGVSGFLKVSLKAAKIGSYPTNLVIALVACVLLYIIVYKSKIGTQIKAVGNDEKLAMNVGLNTDHIKFMSWVISGVFCGLGGISQACYSLSVTAQIGLVTMNMIFKPLIGVLIGVQLVRMWDNLPVLIFVGELIVSIIFNGFIALGLSDVEQNIVLGIFLIVVMAFSSANIVQRRKSYGD